MVQGHINQTISSLVIYSAIQDIAFYLKHSKAESFHTLSTASALKFYIVKEYIPCHMYAKNKFSMIACYCIAELLAQ